MIGYKQQIEEATRELALLENAPDLDLKEELALLMQLEGLSKAREVLLVYLGLNTRTRIVGNPDKYLSEQMAAIKARFFAPL
jgi:hypothetical protein